MYPQKNIPYHRAPRQMIPAFRNPLTCLPQYEAAAKTIGLLRRSWELVTMSNWDDNLLEVPLNGFSGLRKL